MGVYDKAASAILDTLWEDDTFRAFFRQHGYDLGALGPLISRVFVPAYLRVRRTLEGGALEMLEAQVTEDLLGPLYEQPNFRAMWEAWDQPTRDAFLREQSEMQLGRLIVMVYADTLRDAYQAAFLAFLKQQSD